MTASAAHAKYMVKKGLVGNGSSIVRPEHAKFHLANLKKRILNNNNRDVGALFKRLLLGKNTGKPVSGNISMSGKNIERVKYIIDRALIHTPNNKKVSYMEMLVSYYNVISVVNLDELYNNFEVDKNFRCIRYNGTQKVYGGGPCKTKKRKAVKVNSKNKKIKEWTEFQNQIQIVIVDNTGKEYDVKVFNNAAYTITGCQQPKLCEGVSQILIKKINTTIGACANSELSKIIGNEMLLDVNKYSKLTYSLIKSSAKTNIKLKISASNKHGLRSVYRLLTTKYAHLLPPETHPELKPADMPIRLNASQLSTGKKLIFKLVAPDNSLITMHLNQTGTLTSFAKGSMSNVDYGYAVVNEIFTKHYTELSNL